MAKKEQSRAFHFYVDDWLSSKKISMMDAHEERGYLRLLCAAWTNYDCGLPNTDVELSVLSMLGAQWNKPTKDREKRIPGITSGQKLRQCFEIREERLFNERLLREWEYQQEAKKKRSESGVKGNTKRWEKASQADREGIANGSQCDSETIANASQTVSQNDRNYVSVIGSVSSEVISSEKQVPNTHSVELAVASANVDKLEEILGMFIALGRGLTDEDQLACTQKWFSYSVIEQIKCYTAVREEFAEWKTRDISKIPLPINYFKGDYWKRHTSRIVKQTAPRTASDAATDEAKRRFREFRNAQ